MHTKLILNLSPGKLLDDIKQIIMWKYMLNIKRYKNNIFNYPHISSDNSAIDAISLQL